MPLPLHDSLHEQSAATLMLWNVSAANPEQSGCCTAELYNGKSLQHRETAHSMIAIRADYPDYEPAITYQALQTSSISIQQVCDLSHRLFNYASLPARLRWRRSETTTT
jgi:hypothetical protein